MRYEPIIHNEDNDLTLILVYIKIGQQIYRQKPEFSQFGSRTQEIAAHLIAGWWIINVILLSSYKLDL